MNVKKTKSSKKIVLKITMSMTVYAHNKRFCLVSLVFPKSLIGKMGMKER